MTNHKLDNDEEVFFYEQEFYVLSNFSAFKVRHHGTLYDTAEHAYHCMKFAAISDEEFYAIPKEQRVAHAYKRANIVLEIQHCTSAHEAFKLAQTYKEFRRLDWDKVKVGVMKEILWEKVTQHEYVKRKLLETGNRVLIEDSWRDNFWGWGPEEEGMNMLGKLWMSIREEIRNGSIVC